MTTRYTPVEIIAGGVADTRESFAELYVELHELRLEAAAYYHRAFVATEPESGRLAFYPAPPGFGGNELQRRARRVHLERLTSAGLALYAHGVRTALAERDELLARIEEAEHDLERMLIALDGTIAHIVDSQLRHERAHANRSNDHNRAAELQPWDVPVRRPGTDEYLAPGEEA